MGCVSRFKGWGMALARLAFLHFMVVRIFNAASGTTLRNMNAITTSSRAGAHGGVFLSSKRRMQPPRAVPCVHCRSKPATVFLSQIIDGSIEQRNLCAACAAPFFDNPPQAPPFAFLSPASVNSDFLARPKDCPAEIHIEAPVTVLEIAAKLRVKPFQVIAVLVTHHVFITGKEPIDMDTVAIVCRHYGVKVCQSLQEGTAAVGRESSLSSRCLL
jgi:hypothetical protein